MAKDIKDRGLPGGGGADPGRHELVPIIILLVVVALLYVVLAR
jgi:hypothetical protein